MGRVGFIEQQQGRESRWEKLDALKEAPGGPLRPPMVELTAEEIEQLKIDLAAGGVQL
jgi:hypothetical protein